MTQVNSVGTATNYSAVKIRVNEPKAFISGKGDSVNGNYNAVDIAVDKPFMAQYDREIYNYPQNNDTVPGNIAIINTETYYPIAPENVYKEQAVDKQEPVSTQDNTVVPEPNITTPEAEKKNLVYFNGTSKPVEIVQPEEIKPNIDIKSVVAKLSDRDYDVQAKQMDVITTTAIKSPSEAIEYVSKPVFSSLIKILNKDSSELAKPSEQQIETRKKIILNEIVKQKAEEEGKTDVKLPYALTDEEIKSAMVLSDYEQAERNKEYAMYTIAALNKIYISETEKRTGNVLPLTDLPGIAEIVNVLKTSEPNTKLVALESLYYIKRPEYKEELKSIYSMAASDENKNIAQIAANMATALDK